MPDLTSDKGGRVFPPTQSYTSIRRVIRAMRGGSQSQLVQCTDDQFYVTKFLGNPQGPRTLINELLCHPFIKHLGVSTPELRLLDLPQSADQVENVFFHVGSRRVRPQTGLHLGSMCPVNPEETAIFDFLPVRLLPAITNINDFAAMFVLDRLLDNTDSRQAIYIPNRQPNATVSFIAHFIDHGLAFGGKYWHFSDAPLHGLASPRQIYSMLDMRRLTKIAVEKVQAIPAGTVLAVADGVPRSWLIPRDHECLTELLLALRTRQEGLGPLISRHLDALGM